MMYLIQKELTYIWCAWHIDRAWRKAVKRYFDSPSSQQEAYHQLQVLLMESCKTKFQILLTKFLTQHKSSSFLDYFQHYTNHIEQWALCFRVGSPFNSNMHAEAFHRVLKIVYLKHKRNRRLDTLIHVLFQIARDKAYENLQKIEKGKHSHRICDINKRHKTAELFHDAQIVHKKDNEYSVSSQKRPSTCYTVCKIMDSCNCKLKCQFCLACFHQYTCSCLDACTNNTVCKHIHLVHMYINKDVNNAQIRGYDEGCDREHFQRLASYNNSETICIDKIKLLQKIKCRLSQIESLCGSMESTDSLQSVYESLGNISSIALSSDDMPIKKIAANTKSIPQRKFFSTRKKRLDSIRTISKPTITEAMQCEDELNCTETGICAVCFQQDDTLEDDNVQWISCKLCSVWIHLNCININDNNDYICSFCQ